VTIDLAEQAPTTETVAEAVEDTDASEAVATVDDAEQPPDEVPVVIPGRSEEMIVDSGHDELPPPPDAGPDHPTTPAPKARKPIRTARRGRATRRPAQPATAATSEPSTSEDSLRKELSERVAALEAGMADNRRSVADLDQALAAAVEKATTDELVDAKQRVQAAAGSMAALASAISDSAANITTEVSAESATALLISFAAEVENVLLQLGFTPLNTSAGEPFDPTRHRSLRRVTTSDQTLDKVISKVIRDGYQSNASKRILLYSDVEVNRFTPHKESI
jgi:molecular chaperone GrpE (heat shock protein)